MKDPGRPAALVTGVLAVTIAALALGSASASAAVLKGDYRFQDTRGSSVAGAPALIDLSGPNAFATENVLGVPRRVLAFAQGSGLELRSAASLLPSRSYSVVMLVRLDQVGGYRRYLDLAGATSDRGFYTENGRLILFPSAESAEDDPALIRRAAYEQITVMRDSAGVVSGYVNGTRALGPYDDSTTRDGALTATSLRFFKDDDLDPVSPSEDSAGAVARIRVYEGALTPAEVAALAPAEPVLGKAVNVAPVKGRVLVSVPAGAAHASATVPGLKGRRFVPLSEARQIPVGSILDARKGTVRLTSASTASGTSQSAEFSSGVFEVRQSRRPSARGLTELRLKGSSFRACGGRSARRSASDVHTSRSSRRRIRRLRGHGSGRFRTRGRYSAATVRGTDWTVVDRCDGTLTTVRQGTVAVRDFRRRKTVRVRAGKSYLARGRR